MNCRGSVMQDRTGEPPAVMIAPPTAQEQQQPPCGDPFRRTKPPFGKGRCHGGCRDGGIVTGSLVQLTLHDVNPSVKNQKIFASSPYTGEPLGTTPDGLPTWGLLLRFVQIPALTLHDVNPSVKNQKIFASSPYTGEPLGTTPDGLPTWGLLLRFVQIPAPTTQGSFWRIR